MLFGLRRVPLPLSLGRGGSSKGHYGPERDDRAASQDPSLLPFSPQSRPQTHLFAPAEAEPPLPPSSPSPNESFRRPYGGEIGNGASR